MLDRRRFLQSLAGMTAGMMFGRTGLAADGEVDVSTDRLGELLPLRSFGSTGDKVTMLGAGGAHIGRMSELEAQHTIEMALEGGIRFFDTAEQYANGGSERYYGRLLTPKYRDVIYLMTKTRARDAETARKHLEGSLKRLNTDYIDLWQMHSLRDAADPEHRLENGVLEVLLEAQEEGKVRHIGFTGHATPKAHARMLELTEHMQVAQMPINAADPSYSSFIQQVVPTLVDRGMGVIAMKTLAGGGFFGANGWRTSDGPGPKVVPDQISVEEAMHFVWSLPVSVGLNGPSQPHMLEEMIQVAKRFQKLDEGDRQAIVERVAQKVEGTSVEFYKV
jgi:predicted aldo/keto reductase-like oxidoreductase